MNDMDLTFAIQDCVKATSGDSFALQRIQIFLTNLYIEKVERVQLDLETDKANALEYIKQHGIYCEDQAVLRTIVSILKKDDSNKWEPINTRPECDDLMWFCKGEVVEGPKTYQFDDADFWDYWCYAVAPPPPSISRRKSKGEA